MSIFGRLRESDCLLFFPNDDFSMITPLLTDVRTMIFQLIPNRPDLREEFDSKIDLELVKQMITHKAMDVKTEADGLTIYSEGLVTETFKASHTNNTTGTLDLNVSTEVDIDSALINLN